MTYYGNCKLVIRGGNLNLAEIEKNLQIKPTRLVKKGEVLCDVVGKSQYDIWVVEKEIDENRTPAEALKSIITMISPSKEYLQSLTCFAELIIKCYIQSEYAQINFDISPDILKDLAHMNIKFEISILSWGMVKSN